MMTNNLIIFKLILLITITSLTRQQFLNDYDKQLLFKQNKDRFQDDYQRKVDTYFEMNRNNYYFAQQRPIYNVYVQTNYGLFKGTSYKVDSYVTNEMYISSFLGIPYAAPPVGDNRFQFPREPDKKVNIVYDSTYFRSTCFQDTAGEFMIRKHIPDFPSGNFSEDCLYLNIFAPNRTDRLGLKYPVIVFIHGGGFNGGSSQLHNGFILAQRGLVVVTINYRLGPLGFLSTESISSPGNFGLHDQRMAMKYIYENIDYFNGDRQNITLIGHEAGAASIGIHILSQASRLYFNKAILMSGSDLCKWSYLPKEYSPLEFTRSLARSLGCYDFDSFKMIQCLRQRSAQELMNVKLDVPLELGGSPWRPTIDNFLNDNKFIFLENTPQIIRNSGLFYNISVMFGVTSDEGSYLVNNLNIPNIDNGLEEKQYKEILKNYVKTRVTDYYKWVDYQNSIKYADSLYYVNRDENFLDEEGIFKALEYRYTYWPQPENKTMRRQELVDIYSDSLYVSCVNEAARYHTLKFPNRTFMYVFNHRSIKSRDPIWMGSTHGSELYYLFGVPFFNDSNVVPMYGYRLNSNYFNKQDQEISNYTMHLIANFIKYSNPTPIGYFYGNNYLNNYNNYNPYTYNSIGFSTTADLYTRNLNITWIPMHPSNLTYLEINTNLPRLFWNHKFDETGFWNYYWPRLWSRRLTITPTPGLRNALFSYQDSYVLLWVFATISGILSIALFITCLVICKKIKKDKYDEDEF